MDLANLPPVHSHEYVVIVVTATGERVERSLFASNPSGRELFCRSLDTGKCRWIDANELEAR